MSSAKHGRYCWHVRIYAPNSSISSSVELNSTRYSSLTKFLFFDIILVFYDQYFQANFLIATSIKNSLRCTNDCSVWSGGIQLSDSLFLCCVTSVRYEKTYHCFCYKNRFCNFLIVLFQKIFGFCIRFRSWRDTQKDKNVKIPIRTPIGNSVTADHWNLEALEKKEEKRCQEWSFTPTHIPVVTCYCRMWKG